MARRRDSQGRRPRRARVEELESRILLSAELPGVVLAETLAHPDDAQEIFEPLVSPEPFAHVIEQQASRHELVFVDTGVEDWESLVDDLLGQGPDQRTVEVVLLDADRDGLSQISETLARYSGDLDAVHVVSHGTSQGIQLGGTWLDQSLLDSGADLVAGWRDALSEDADLLLYGCNLAASSEGKALIEQLAGLTGADVAASTDLTGSTALGGDWDLEHRTGSIESFVIFTARAQQGYGAVLGGTAIWADNGVPAPQTSDFDGASFGPESNSAAVGEWRVIAGAEAPTRDEKIVLGTNMFGNLSGQIWDGSTWTALPGISAGLNVDEWSFDVAYSSQSGDALIVWRSASDIAFATWDGTSLSATTSVPTPFIGTPTHIELAADPNSDEIMVVGSSISLGGFAMVWDGTNFVDSRFFAKPGSIYATDIDVVYEAQSGHAMVVYGDGNDIHYEIYDGVTWTGGDVSDPSGPSSEARWTELASDPNSDRIAMVVGTDSTAWLAVWDGSTWQPSVAASDNTLHADRQNVAVAFESNSGEAIAAYTRFGADDVRYQRWTAAGGWSGELAGPTLSSQPDSFTLDPDPNSDAIMLSVVVQGRDVEFLVWDGDAFGTPNTLEVDAGTNRGQPFLFLWDQGLTANAAPIADASAGAPHVIPEGGTLDLDGSASSDPGGSIVSWEWDIGNDGTFEKSGVNASYDWAELNAAGIIDEGTVDVALRVTDDGGLTHTQVFALTVDNAAPTITATGASSVDVGAIYTLNLFATDPGDDTITGWTINWGDGTIETVAGNPPSVTHVYTQAGFTRNITVSARDEDGSWTNSDLIVGQYINNSDLVYRFDANTGALISTFASSAGDVDRAYSPVVGPDGNFYVSGYDSNNVVRYDSAGNYLGEFVLSGAGGLSRADGLAFGPDGNLYVSSYQSDEILRFDSSGAFIDIFGSGGGLDGPTGLAFGPDGDLYVASWNNGRLLKIDGKTGGTATTVIGSGLSSPEQIAFDGAGNLYIATGWGSTVERWDGVALTTYFSSPLLSFATGLTFGPDGWLYVSSYNNDRILRFDGSTTEVFVPSGSGGLDQPEYLSFTPAQQVLIVATPQPPSVTSTVTDEDVQSTSGLVLDRNVADGAEVTHFKITNITNGTLYQNDGLTVINDGDFITFGEGNAGLRFTPAPDYSGPASFDVEASTTGDDTSLSGLTTASITVNPANDAPVLAPGAPVLTPITEDDTGNGGDLISSLLASSVSDIDPSAVEGIAITGLSGANGVWEYDSGSGFTAVGPVSETSALLLRATDRIRFVPDARNGGVASFDFRAWDQTTGVAGGRVDTSLPGGTSAFSIASDTASIVVTDVNDAPVLSNTPTLLLDDVTANAGPPTGADGTLVSSLIDFPGGGGLDNVTDVDAGAVTGIAVMKLDSTNGTWHYSLDDGSTWLLIPDVNANAALLLAAEPGVRLYFEPTPGFSGTIVDAIEFRAWDGTSGTNGGFGDTAPGGGQTAFSTFGDYADITVLPPASSAPSGSDATVVTDEDVPYVFSVADFGFSDPDGDLLQGVLIETVPTLGTLRNGVSVLTGGEIVSEADITAGNLVFTPIADASGAPYVSFSFRVQDDSGATGFDTDSTPNTITLDVNPANDAPVLDDTGALTLTDVAESDPSPAGDTVAAILASAGGDPISDVDTGAVEGIAVTGVDDSNGTWQYSTDGGTIWTDFGPVSDASAVVLDTAARIRFVPDVGFVGPAGDMKFRAWDQSTGANGQTGVDASTNGLTTAFSVGVETVSVDVTAFNAAPVLTPSAPNLTPIHEDDTGNPGDDIAALVGGSIADANVGALQGLAITSLRSGNGTWQYSLDGGVAWTGVGAVSDSSALLLRATDRVRFVPDTLNADAASFDFRAWDQTTGTAGARVDASLAGASTAFSVASDTASISVSARNDAPDLAGEARLAGVVANEANPPGATISSLVGGSFSDVDAGAGMTGVAVVGNSADSSQGVWQYSSDGGANWFAIASVADNGSALSLSATTLVRFVPNATFGGAPAPLALRGIDDSYAGGFSSTAGGAEARALVDTSSNGGTSAISATTSAVSTTVTAAIVDVTRLDIDPGEPEPDPTGTFVPEADPDEPEQDAVAPDTGTPTVGPLPESTEVEVPRFFDPGQPLADILRPGLVPTTDQELPSAEREERDQRITEAGTRTALDVLRDIYLGRSNIDGDTLANLIFGTERGDFMQDLDVAQEDIRLLLSVETRMASSAVAVTSGLSVGYVLWLTRGGLLIASLLSSMPAWRLIDPIPVLAHLGLPDEDEDDESIGSLVSHESGQKPARAGADDPTD